MKLLYHIALRLYYRASFIVGLFNKKASLFYRGRIGLLDTIKNQIDADLLKDNNNEPIIWVHCASVGEFEQGRPLIESYKLQNPSHRILLTFFSPSGYELRKNYNLAEWVFYLPIDTKNNAVSFLDIVQPNMAIFIKYEYWFNFLFELHRREIPTYVASAIFLPNQRFFKWYGGLFRKMLKNFTHIFVQDQASALLLSTIGITNVTVSGDTRFDRVDHICRTNGEIDHVKIFSQGTPCWVAGSSWPIDEEMIAAIFPNLPFCKLIIAPHEVHHNHIDKICAFFSDYKVIKYSQIKNVRIDARIEARLRESRILIIDSIGILSVVYKYGSFAYIGGGFGAGIHNTLEAATYGVPVIFGPKYKKFKEAVDLVESGGAVSVKRIKELNIQVKKMLSDDQYRINRGLVCSKYINSNIGATDKVIKYLQEHKI